MTAALAPTAAREFANPNSHEAWLARKVCQCTCLCAMTVYDASTSSCAMCLRGEHRPAQILPREKTRMNPRRAA